MTNIRLWGPFRKSSVATTYETIIVGGSAGSVIAHRLAAKSGLVSDNGPH